MLDPLIPKGELERKNPGEIITSSNLIEGPEGSREIPVVWKVVPRKTMARAWKKRKEGLLICSPCGESLCHLASFDEITDFSEAHSHQEGGHVERTPF